MLCGVLLLQKVLAAQAQCWSHLSVWHYSKYWKWYNQSTQHFLSI